MSTNNYAKDCFLCRKHQGLEQQPPGGYIYSDQYWLICHAPPEKGPLGTLFIESKRHFLDFKEMDAQETASYGQLCKILYTALKKETGAERIYTIIFLEGIPHFHAWLIPRRAGEEKGLAFLTRDIQCSLQEATKLSNTLKKILTKGNT